MKPLILNPELVIPRERKPAFQSLSKRAREEKEMGRPLDEILADTKEAMRVIRKTPKPNSDEGEGWFYVPLVPVMEAPEDLMQYGTHVIYNGHHRLAAAKETGIYLPCMLLENDDDIKRAVARGEQWVEDLDGSQDFSFIRRRGIIWEKARKLAGF